MTRRMRLCEVTDCGRRHCGHGYCRTHLARWRRNGDPQPDVAVSARDRSGETYWAVGKRLRTECGPASARRCAGCAAPAACWSYDGTDPHERTDPVRGYRYSLDLARYRPRCRSCHRRSTLARSRPRARSAAVEVERAARLYRSGASVTGIAAVLDVSRTAVHTALRNHGVPLRRPGHRTKTAAMTALEGGPVTTHPDLTSEITDTSTTSEPSTTTAPQAKNEGQPEYRATTEDDNRTDHNQSNKRRCTPRHPDPLGRAAGPGGPAPGSDSVGSGNGGAPC